MKKWTLVFTMSLWAVIACASTVATDKQQVRLSCETSGCNQEICAEKGKKLISPCVILPQHECLRKTKCEVQENGKCGWTPNEDYKACMKRFGPK